MLTLRRVQHHSAGQWRDYRLPVEVREVGIQEVETEGVETPYAEALERKLSWPLDWPRPLG